MEAMLRPRPNSAIEELDEAVSLMVAASARVLRRVAEVDERKPWERDGATPMASWLAARHGFAWGNGREWVRVAHALRDLPDRTTPSRIRPEIRARYFP